MTEHSKAIIRILFVMLVWGSSFAVTKNAIQEIPPVYFAFLRFLVASILLTIMYLLKKKAAKESTMVSFKQVFLIGLTGIPMYYLFFNYSLLYTSASMGALIQAFIPVLIALLAAIFLKGKLNAKQWISIAISVIGVGLVGLAAPADVRSPNPLLGNMLMIIAVAAWAVYTILFKKVSDADVLQITCLSTIVGTVLLIPFTVIELWHQPIPKISFSGWATIIYLGALASALSYFLYNDALKNLPASLVGIFINLDPIIGAGIAVLFLKESITIWQIAGTALVLIGIWLSAGKKEDSTQIEPSKTIDA